jgi:hypothetical protein
MKILELFTNEKIQLSEDTGPLGFLRETGGVGRIVKGVNTTADVQPGETQRQAAKFKNTTDKEGRPPIARTDGKYDNISSK